MKYTQEEKREALNDLKRLFRSKDKTVYVVQKHVSNSGMMRVLYLFVIRDNEPINITHLVSRVLDWSMHKDIYGIKVGGCGMNMHFHTVYTLSRVLYRDRYKGDAGYKLEYRSI